MKQRLLFLTLNTFSATGGIEKVCRAAAKAMHEIARENGTEFLLHSMYDADTQVNEAYVPACCFKGFDGRRLQFIWNSVRVAQSTGTVVISHVNLLPVGYLIKKFFPKTRLLLVAHGIEVWDKIGRTKKNMLRCVDLFLPVSSFTAAKLQTVHKIQGDKIRVLNNCLDPYLNRRINPVLQNDLRKKYGIGKDDAVLLTVTRLKFSEQYKGYDKVVEALPAVRQTHPGVKYLIVGKYDAEEKARLDNIILRHGLSDAVIFAGFAKDEELNEHFTIADAYVMPSTGEGFGIVFIEALFYGLPVIAGNADGSVDALAGGEFGLLVNPSDPSEIVASIRKVLTDKNTYRPDAGAVTKKFGFDGYKASLKQALCFPLQQGRTNKRRRYRKEPV